MVQGVIMIFLGKVVSLLSICVNGDELGDKRVNFVVIF